MSLRPDMTLTDLAHDEDAQRQLVEMILDRGVRGAMNSRRISYDSADVIAGGVKHGVRAALEALPKLTDTD